MAARNPCIFFEKPPSQQSSNPIVCQHLCASRFAKVCQQAEVLIFEKVLIPSSQPGQAEKFPANICKSLPEITSICQQANPQNMPASRLFAVEQIFCGTCPLHPSE
jgi:hypothetical protein